MPHTDLKYLQTTWENAPQTNAFYPLARAYFDAGLYAAAADVLQQGLRHHPGHAQGLTLLGRIQYQRGESDEARDIFQKALNADPSCSDPLCALAELEIAAGNCARAETWLERAESSKETVWSKRLRQDLECKQDIDPAVGTELPFVTQTMVDLYLKQGMKEKALAALKQLVDQNPEDSSLRQRLDALSPRAFDSSEEQVHSKAELEARLSAWLRAVEHRKQRR
ncbi:MAG: tetratricopeptide repeat protein [Desulfuromonadaceae bacterium]